LAERLNPLFEVEGKEVAMLTPELAGVPTKALGAPIGDLSSQRGAIIAALDLVITGI
jgi:toxin CcdB